MNLRRTLLALAYVTFSLTSCSTVFSRIASAEEDAIDYAGVYPGPRLSFDFFFRPAKVDEGLVDVSPAVKAPLMLVGVLDLPFALAADTLLLPFDAAAYAVSASRPGRCGHGEHRRP